MMMNLHIVFKCNLSVDIHSIHASVVILCSRGSGPPLQPPHCKPAGLTTGCIKL